MNYATVPTDDEFHDIQTSHTEHEQDWKYHSLDSTSTDEQYCRLQDMDH